MTKRAASDNVGGMTTKRFALWPVMVIALACVALGVAWFVITPEPSVTLIDFKRIELGMSVNEVNSIFRARGEMGPCGEGECPWSWKHGDNYAEVSFGQWDGKATCGCYFTPDGEQHWLRRKK